MAGPWDKYNKSEDSDSKPWDKYSQEPKDSGSNFMDMLKGYTSGATLGAQNVLGGATQAGLDAGQAALNKMGLAKPSPSQVTQQLQKQGATGDTGPSTMDLYQQGKEQTKKDFNISQTRSPILYGGSALVGASVPMALAGTSPASLAAQGAIGNVASSDADLIGPNQNLPQAALNATIGAGIGYGAGKIGNVIKNLSATGAKSAAIKQAVRAVGLSPEFDKGALQAGEQLLDRGNLPITGNQKTLNASLQQAKQSAGNDINQAVNKVASNVGEKEIQQANPITEKVDDLTNNFIKNSNLNDSDTRKVLSAAKNEFTRIEQAEGDVNSLNQIKRDLQDAAKKTYGNNSPQQNTAVQNYYNELANLVKTHIEDLGNATQSGAGDEIAQANAKYTPIKNAADNALEAAKNEDLNAGKLEFNPYTPIKSTSKLIGIKDPTLLGRTTTANILNKTSNVLNNPLVQDVKSKILSPAIQGIGTVAPTGNIFNLDDNTYNDYSNKLQQNPKTAHLGMALGKAVANNDSLAKTQALFVIQQNPQAKKQLSQEDLNNNEQTDLLNEYMKQT